VLLAFVGVIFIATSVFLYTKQDQNRLGGTGIKYFDKMATQEIYPLSTSTESYIGVDPLTSVQRKAFSLITAGQFYANGSNDCSVSPRLTFIHYPTCGSISNVKTWSSGMDISDGYKYKWSIGQGFESEGLGKWDAFTITHATMTSPMGLGLIGFSTSSPVNRITIGGREDHADADIGFLATATTSNEGPYAFWTAGVDYTDFKFKVSSSTVLGTNDRMVIDGNGFVGISTSTPMCRLHVNGNAIIDNENATTTVTFGGLGGTQGACEKHEDIDGSGYTYCTFLNGSMNCSSNSCE
jgi:hypothetical protein